MGAHTGGVHTVRLKYNYVYNRKNNLFSYITLYCILEGNV